MSYERDLAFNLRIRGLSEDAIAEALDEVRAHAITAGSPANEEFGSSQEYARQFPRQKARSRGYAVATVGAVLAITYAAAMFLLPFLGMDVRGFVGPIMLWPALVLILGGVVSGFLTDYFRPLPTSRVH
ncbi:hypothetical protein [Arthrobacter sp. EPSL27]|uniref:hypothetical protein n=1 Tax=Arthrobacter sp. EPSL27 TaxID=1745378 RepID=UPI000748968D|nr:hypothetical protein [Arthrobacter sp. EPSL27]KUM37229.1 hypothetical protein AR539_08010 [Arthrobacter sp. EPSL27]